MNTTPASELAAPERLLDAAETVFAQCGYNGSSIREITGLAGCNVAAVNYHFGGKEKLYQAAFTRVVGRLRQQRVAAMQELLGRPPESLTLEVALRRFADVFMAPRLCNASGPRLLQFMLREMSDSRLPAGFFVEQMVLPVVQALRSVFAHLGLRLEDTAAHRCIESFIAQLLHIVRARRNGADAAFASTFGGNLNEAIDHIVRFSAAGIRACADEN